MESWPEFVIVPARRSPDSAEVELETRHSLTGLERVLPAFSSVKNLVRLLGYGQPWVCVRLLDARAAAAAAGLGRVVIDPEEMAWQPASRSLVLQSVGLLHTQLTATVQGDAANLQATYTQYRAAEDKTTHLVTAIATPDQAGGGRRRAAGRLLP